MIRLFLGKNILDFKWWSDLSWTTMWKLEALDVHFVSAWDTSAAYAHNLARERLTFWPLSRKPTVLIIIMYSLMTNFRMRLLKFNSYQALDNYQPQVIDES